MKFIMENKGKIGAACVIVIILAAAYFWSGNHEKGDEAQIAEEVIFEADQENSSTIKKESEKSGIAETEINKEATGEKEEKKTEEENAPEKEERSDAEETPKKEERSDAEDTPKSEERSENEGNTAKAEYEPPQKAEEPQNAEAPDDKELYCTLSVRCDTALNNSASFDPQKRDILPSDGVIFAERRIEFQDGESVFDLLKREMRNNGIHLEFVNTPVYGSVYIEGIGNIYEFDAGELSGWMYKVNGEFPNYGCSKYTLKQGDKVEFVYTCDLGKDVGNAYKGK